MSAFETERFGNFAKTGDNFQGFSDQPTRCMTVVTPEFIAASVECSEAIIELNTMDNPDDFALIPREFWTRWVAAAQVIRDFGKTPKADGGPIPGGTNPLNVECE